MKRLFDIVVSFFLLLAFAPLFCVVALMLKRERGGTVFSARKRAGRGFVPFNLYTFRTTAENRPRDDDSMSAGTGAAATKVGWFLRKTGIDALPQLWNVLKGDMSIVGPRPEREKCAYSYVDDYNEILKVRPGIIDMSPSTSADEEALLAEKENPDEYYTHVLQPDKIKLARSYLKRSSLLFDLELIGIALIKCLYPHRVVTKAIEAVLPYRRPVVVSAELLLCVIANYLAFLIRFEGDFPPHYLTLFLRYLPLLILLRTLFLFLFSLDRGLWQYASIKDLFNIATAVSLGSLLFFVILRYFFGETAYPRSIYMMDWLLTIFLLGGARLFWRLHREKNFSQGTRQRIIVFGAGNAADMFLRDIENSLHYSCEVIGLIDDNLRKKGLKIRGVPILGTRKDIAAIVAREEPDEFLITMPSASPQVMQAVVKELRKYGLPVKTLPGLMGILSGRGAIDQIKVVEPEDVLFRPPAHEEGVDVKSLVEGKKVLITGAGGSIGSELSRQVAALGPDTLILFERHEESLFNLDRGLANNPAVHVVPVIGDILNEERLRGVMDRYRPDIVFHAAAYKHVPLMEDNPYEAYRANVVGSRIVAEAARRHGVERFVLISTDKAVNSVNVMGQTKRIAEEIVRHMAKEEKGTTKYLIVRFGNVLGSSGSVVPTFKDQIKRGGPVTVTHPEMTRFFMTIPEAVALVLQASAMGGGGDVFVLDMGEPVKILDLAKRMIGLYGLKVNKDIDIKVTGLRPGEKLFEELFNADEKVKRTSHPKINMALANGRVNSDITQYLSEPDTANSGRDVRELLTRLAH